MIPAVRLLTFNEIFLARLKDVGAISPEDAIDFGLTGPCLRACGVSYDLRKAAPYSVYDRFDFDVPLGLDGDSWDRHYVRVQEMRESIGIVRQALDQMPKGDVVSSLGRRLIRPPKGEVFMRAENPRGEIGVYLVSDGTDKPYRVKIRPPSFCNLSSITDQVYDRFDFDVPLGLDGDSWDRHYVRVQEMRESIGIVRQALDQMPKGDVVSSLGRRLIRPPKGEVFMRAENPRGEIGVYLVSDGTDKPYRVKIRPPSFCNLSSIKHLLKGIWVADAVVVLGSLDIVLGEVDR